MSENDNCPDCIDYKCPDCGFIVRFFEGFVIQCKGTPNRVSHFFTIGLVSE